jgi:hypothetical protein
MMPVIGGDGRGGNKKAAIPGGSKSAGESPATTWSVMLVVFAAGALPGNQIADRGTTSA